MIDIKKEKVETYRLQLGMFVVELDKPWIGSPFMLQGFLLDDQDDLDKMRSFCDFVYIDRTRSANDHFAVKARQDVTIKRKASSIRISNPNSKDAAKKIPSLKKLQNGEKVSFLDIMREIRNYEAPENTQSKANTVYNLRHGADSTRQTTLPYENEKTDIAEKTNESLSSNLLNTIGGLFRRKKSENTGTDADSKSKKNGENDDYRITIYEEEPPVENEIATIYPVYEETQIATRDIFNAIANAQALDISAVSEVLDSLVESIGRTPDALLWLSKLKQTDDYAYNHSLNVSITLMAFSNFLAFSNQQIKNLGLAGLLQDIGKIKLSSDVLLKESKLTREEYAYAQKHVDESVKIIQETPNIPHSVMQFITEHHERIDGSGYPTQLKENQLSIASQAAGLIDTYCAITSHRSYAKALYHQEALDVIHDLSGKQFNTELVDHLSQFMGIYPVSSLVELNTGEVAVVIQQNQVRRLLPRIMLLLDPKKERYKSPSIVNLLLSPKTPSGVLYSIVKSLAPDSYGLNPNDFYV